MSGSGILARPADGERLIFDIGRAAGGHQDGSGLRTLPGGRGPGRLEARRPRISKNGLGRDCICCLSDGRLFLRRIIRGSGDRYTLVPLVSDGDIRYNQDLLWAARLVLRLEYL